MTSRCLLRHTAAELNTKILAGIDAFTKELRAVSSHKFGRKISPSESDSWARSIHTVVQRLLDAELGGVEVLIEMRTPITTASMDMVLVGSHPRTGDRSIVVVENKQWSEAKPIAGTQLVTHPGPGNLHPANQVWSYCLSLTSYLAVLHDAKIFGVVNLHNADSANVADIHPSIQGLDTEVCEHVRMFCQDQRSDFIRFLRGVLSPLSAAEHADDVLQSQTRPTPRLMKVVGEAVKDRSIFPLIEEQREAYDTVLAEVTRSHHGSHKKVVIILGGPGTGKSVIAIELLGKLSRLGIDSVHATGSKAFTNTLRECIGGTKKQAKQVFTYFNNHAHVTENSYRVLLADEAHRIRKSSNLRYTPRDRRSSISQIEELIHVARVPVFLLDEKQGVRNGEVGDLRLIEQAADRLGYDVKTIRLRHQFRCGGDPEYLQWLEDLLYREPRVWEPNDRFELRLADSPRAMEDYLRRRIAEGRSARIAAGYCWPWSPPAKDGSLADDVKIEDWARPWNARSDRPKNGIPPSDLWATDPAGFEQIGCIYTAQGFEYDYAGVILGRDLVWSDDHWVADPKANCDSKARGAGFSAWVRNTYRVLATRGMRGAVLYSDDPATQRMLVGLGIPLIRATRHRQGTNGEQLPAESR